MIIDLILDRDDKTYDPAKFYSEVQGYNATFEGIGNEILDALDNGTEYDVKRALCLYVLDNDYSMGVCGSHIYNRQWLPSEITSEV